MSRTETAHEDPLGGEDQHDETPKKQKSRRPANTAFRQQRLKAWQPILTPKTVLPIFFAIGIIFAPIGGLLLWASATVQELTIDYTNCASAAQSTMSAIPDEYVTSSFKTKSTDSAQWMTNVSEATPLYGAPIQNTNICTLQFNVPNDIGPPVLLYYRLTNFYQNHRRYVKSLDLNQLKGHFLSNKSMEGSACNPLIFSPDPDKKPYYPCGLIANSIFNDTINSPRQVNVAGSQEPSTYNMTRKGIAWASDLKLYGETAYNHSSVLPPPNWALRYPTGYNDTYPIPNLSEYEEFAVWMRTAGLPTFSKLALRNDDEKMPAGTYQIEIYDWFPVKEYGGTKTLLLSTRTVMGGKNSFLGIAYVVVGGLCVVMGVLFTVAHLIKPRKLGDHTYLSWNNDSAPIATTTGRDSQR